MKNYFWKKYCKKYYLSCDENLPLYRKTYRHTDINKNIRPSKKKKKLNLSKRVLKFEGLNFLCKKKKKMYKNVTLATHREMLCVFFQFF